MAKLGVGVIGLGNMAREDWSKIVLLLTAYLAK